MIDAARIKGAVRQSVSTAAAAAASLHRDLDPAIWGLSVDDDGRLTRGDLALPDLAARHGSPVHVVDLDRLDERLGQLTATVGRDVVATTHHLVAVGPLIRRIHDHGLIGVVTSIEEFERAIVLGIDPGTVLYAEVAPTTETLAAAHAFGPRAVVTGSADVLDLAIQVATSNPTGRPMAIMLGMAAPGPGGPIGGFRADGADVPAALTRIDAETSTTLAGVRVLVDGAIADAQQATAAAAGLATVGELLTTANAPGLEVVLSADLAPATAPAIGGARGRLNRFAGLDLPAPRPETAADIATLVREGRAALQTSAPAGVRLIVEPGRALTASSQFLLASVLDIKDDGEPVHVVLDAGINLAEQTQYHYHQLFNASCATGAAQGPFRMVGPICTPADVLYTNWRLPRVEIGDVLAIMDTGAGFVATSTSFSFPRPAVIGCSGDEVTVLRRAETFDDLIDLDIVEPLGGAD